MTRRADSAAVTLPRLRVVPLTLAQANATVARWHRHHKPVVGHRFSLGCMRGNDLCGAVIVGRPVARNTAQYHVAEVTRLVTDGTKNACSILYAAAARACAAMGFTSVQTFILASEPGTSLKAAGWERVGVAKGHDWNCKSMNITKSWLFDDYRKRDQMDDKVKWEKVLA